MQLQANIISSLRIQNLWTNQITFDLDMFKINTFMSFIFNEDFEICPGLGWQTERVLFKILWAMSFWNCSKILVNDLADFSTTWTGVNALYFEDCEESENVSVVFYEKEFEEANLGIAWSGTIDPKSVKYCVGLFGTSGSGLSEEADANNSSMLLAKMAYKTFFNWAQDAYPESF